MPTNKRNTSHRLSDEARSIMQRLAQHHAVSETAVLEMALRRMLRADLPAHGWPPAALVDLAVRLVEEGDG